MKLHRNKALLLRKCDRWFNQQTFHTTEKPKEIFICSSVCCAWISWHQRHYRSVISAPEIETSSQFSQKLTQMITVHNSTKTNSELYTQSSGRHVKICTTSKNIYTTGRNKELHTNNVEFTQLTAPDLRSPSPSVLQMILLTQIHRRHELLRSISGKRHIHMQTLVQTNTSFCVQKLFKPSP